VTPPRTHRNRVSCPPPFGRVETRADAPNATGEAALSVPAGNPTLKHFSGGMSSPESRNTSPGTIPGTEKTNMTPNTTTTAEALAAAERNLHTAAQILERLQNDTETDPDSLAVELTTSRETLAICERRAQAARTAHHSALVQELGARLATIESEAGELDSQAEAITAKVKESLLKHFSEQGVERLLRSEQPTEAVELRRKAGNLRDRVESARSTAKTSPALALRELETL